MMSIHKLTAGDGYLYLIRQTAAHDATTRGRASLSDYYTEKGEASGRWIGRGLPGLAERSTANIGVPENADLWSLDQDSMVTEDHMKALFGLGWHPNAEAIMHRMVAQGASLAMAKDAARLGRPFQINEGTSELQQQLAVAYRDHNLEQGEHWNAPIEDKLRAEMKTRTARELFTEHYGRPPLDDRELTGFIAQQSREKTTSVAGYDLTFTPVKSVSVLWALAPTDIATIIEQCHDQAVADALDFLQDNAAFSRTGAQGIAQIDTDGFIAAAFTHRDSRAGDPNLHTHVAVSNKVRGRGPDGVTRWLALDGRTLYKWTVAASEVYNTRLEGYLNQYLILQFEARETSERDKRPVREIIGISADLCQQFSSRRAAIKDRFTELAKQFQIDHAREPTTPEAIALAQQATLETRAAKHEPRSFAEQRQQWRTQAREVLGDEHAVSAMLATALSAPPTARTQITSEWIAEQAQKIVGTVARSRSSWQRTHIYAEAQRLVRCQGLAGDHDLADALTDAALQPPLSVAHARIYDTEHQPAALCRRDGTSVYRNHGTELFTSTDILAAERRILAAAGRHDGRQAPARDVELALKAQQAERGRALNSGQQSVVQQMATCGARLQLALAPAGTGKTTAMSVLTRAWEESGGRVLGLAPSANAAQILREDINTTTDTVDKFLWLATHPEAIDDPARAWFDRIDASTLIIIDEAGKAGTLALDGVINTALARGASVRLIGDDRQLASISAGGVLRDIAETTGALELTEVVRFVSRAEAHASTALRVGDPSAVAFYADHHRIHVSAEGTATDQAYQAWREDLDRGHDSLLLAPTNTAVAELNERARLARLEAELAAGAPAHGGEAELADGLRASVGDIVATRRNQRRLRIAGARDFVRNGYRWRVSAVHSSGALTVQLLNTGHRVTLPPWYVRSHTTLGYAFTIDGSQGMTVGTKQHTGTCRIVGAESMSRQQLYTAMTRATHENHIYFSTAETDEHAILAPKATHPDTAIDVLTRILGRDDSQISATTAQRYANDPFLQLGCEARKYFDALGHGARQLLGAAHLAALDADAEALRPGLTESASWSLLRNNLAIVAAHGHAASAVLTRAAQQGELDNAADPAAVLDWRIDTTAGAPQGSGPLRWLPALPAALSADPDWGPYLSFRAEHLASLAGQIRTTAASWDQHSAPRWARPLLAAGPQADTSASELIAELALFRAAFDIAEPDTRLTGPTQPARRPRQVQQMLEQAGRARIGTTTTPTKKFDRLIDAIDPRIRSDPYWPQLASDLATIARTGVAVSEVVHDAASLGPLPDEMPGAALWWRLSGQLSPATLETTSTALQPVWMNELHDVFGTAIAETIAADPTFPALVAAIDDTDPQRWTPTDLLQLADEHLREVDPDRTLVPHDYTRLLTYAINLFAPEDPYDSAIPAPTDAPLTPEQEEELRHLVPDPDYPIAYHDDSDNLFWASDDTYLSSLGAHDFALDLHEDEELTAPEELSGLAFEDLLLQRPVPPSLPVALENLTELRAQLAHAIEAVSELERAIAHHDGPALRAARPALLALRERADHDRPYLLAVCDVVARWSDADHDYEQAIAHHDWAANELAQLQSQADVDPLDLHSAQRAVDIAAMALPSTSPAEQFQPELAAARAARVHAAGGEHHIVTTEDVDAARHRAENDDRAALRAARAHRDRLQVGLARAETAAAAAFADAHTRSADYLRERANQLHTELQVLQAAGGYDISQAITIGEDAGAHLPDLARRGVRTLAGAPFTITPVHIGAESEALAAMAVLYAAHAAAGRRVLWCAPTQAQITRASDAHVADEILTVDQVEMLLGEQNAELPAGTLVIVEQAADLPAHTLSRWAQRAMSTKGRLILLDDDHDSGWPPKPSAALLALLAKELPWAVTLGTSGTVDRRRQYGFDRAPMLDQAQHWDSALLSDELAQALARRAALHRDHTSAYRVHTELTWRISGATRNDQHRQQPGPTIER